MSIDRSGMIQVKATWREGLVAPEARSSAEHEAYAREVASRLAAEGIEPWSNDVSEMPPSDAETEEALAASRGDGLSIMFDAKGVDISGPVPLLVDHVGAPVVEDLEIGVKGREFTATGWAASDSFDQLSGIVHCSPHFWISKARIAEIGGIRYLNVLESVLREVSATNEPIGNDTSFAVAPPGVRFWAAPTWDTAERFTRSEPATQRFAAGRSA
jgi:hypothetical protein